MCVRLMLPGEKSVVTCPPDFAYDKFPRLYTHINHHIRIHFSYTCFSNTIRICFSYEAFWIYYYNRPANVPEGAYVQWEIELLRFELPKVRIILLDLPIDDNWFSLLCWWAVLSLIDKFLTLVDLILISLYQKKVLKVLIDLINYIQLPCDNEVIRSSLENNLLQKCRGRLRT
jgi:hypothetical protein